MIQASFKTTNALFAIVNYLYSMTNVLTPLSVGDAPSWMMVVNALFALITTAGVFLIVTAMLVAMIARVVILWVIIAVAPLGVLIWALNDLLPAVGSMGGKEFDIKGTFFQVAFLPTLVAFPLSVGFVLLLAGLSLDYQPSASELQSTLMHTDSANAILWWIAGIGVIYIGTFKMLKKVPIVSSTVGSIEKIGTNFVGGMGKLAMNTPLTPIGGPNLALSDIGRVANMPSDIAGKISGGRGTVFSNVDDTLAETLDPNARKKMDHTKARNLLAGLDANTLKNNASLASKLNEFAQAGMRSDHTIDAPTAAALNEKISGLNLHDGDDIKQVLDRLKDKCRGIDLDQNFRIASEKMQENAQRASTTEQPEPHTDKKPGETITVGTGEHDAKVVDNSTTTNAAGQSIVKIKVNNNQTVMAQKQSDGKYQVLDEAKVAADQLSRSIQNKRDDPGRKENAAEIVKQAQVMDKATFQTYVAEALKGMSEDDMTAFQPILEKALADKNLKVKVAVTYAADKTVNATTVTNP